MKIGIAADHGGFELKEILFSFLAKNHEVKDFGATAFNKGDDYPDFIVPMARALAANEIERGIAICGSGVGASIAANKVNGVRAALVHDIFSAHQGVEDDGMNMICLGGSVIGSDLAKEIVLKFLNAQFSGKERHKRRLEKVIKLENE